MQNFSSKIGCGKRVKSKGRRTSVEDQGRGRGTQGKVIVRLVKSTITIDSLSAMDQKLLIVYIGAHLSFVLCHPRNVKAIPWRRFESTVMIFSQLERM